MKKFEFSLQVLYDVKKNTEQALKNELSDISDKIKGIELDVARMDGEMNKAADEYARSCKSGTTVLKLQAHGLYFKRYMDERRQKLSQKQKLEIKRSQTQEKLVKLLNELKALDKMHDNEYMAYLAELKIEEDKELDNFINFQIHSAS